MLFQYLLRLHTAKWALGLVQKQNLKLRSFNITAKGLARPKLAPIASTCTISPKIRLYGEVCQIYMHMPGWSADQVAEYTAWVVSAHERCWRSLQFADIVLEISGMSEHRSVLQ